MAIDSFPNADLCVCVLGLSMLNAPPALLRVRWCLHLESGALAFEYDRSNNILFVCIEFTEDEREHDTDADSDVENESEAKTEAAVCASYPLGLSAAMGAARLLLPLSFIFQTRSVHLWQRYSIHQSFVPNIICVCLCVAVVAIR